MSWIKKNPHLLVLILAAVALLAVSGLIAMNVQSYPDKFTEVQQKVTPSAKIAQVDTSVLEAAKAQVAQAAQWKTPANLMLPFVPTQYSIDTATGQPKKSIEGNHWKQRLTQQFIPDKWFLDNRLPVTEPSVITQDPDNDGFANDDEWLYKTDPNNKDSHPAYHTRLFVKKYIRVPFRLKFQAYDGDPKKDKPEDMSFQINTLEIRQPSNFLKIGEPVPKTKFKLEKFEYKVVVNESIGAETDVSELTLVDTETGSKIVLVNNRITDSPDSYALFTYLWPNPPVDIQVKKLQPFVLLPNRDDRYKLLDITEAEAQIQTPAGETVKVPLLPPNYP